MFKIKNTIAFMKHRHLATAFSLILIAVSIGSFITKGISLGLDFTGGSLLELRYEHAANVNDIRSQLADLGYSSASVIHFGSDREVQVRFQTEDPQQGDVIAKQLIAQSGDNTELVSISYVGPQVGKELTNDGGLGMLLSLAMVMIYVALRFQFKFSVGAVGALIHDVIIVLGCFSFFELDFDLTVLAAVLAVIGYSLNDTIVVFDRLRENFRTLRKTEPVDLVNISLTQTLGRTIMTGLTTLLVLFALYFLGGEMIHNFALALIIGIVIGTYSSVYIATNILLIMKTTSADLIPVVKEGSELDEMP